jgi:hypothetical protein
MTLAGYVASFRGGETPVHNQFGNIVENYPENYLEPNTDQHVKSSSDDQKEVPRHEIKTKNTSGRYVDPKNTISKADQSTKVASNCCSSTSVYATDWSRTGLLKQKVFAAHFLNMLMDPNENVSSDVGLHWKLKYEGNLLADPSEGFTLSKEIRRLISSISETPEHRYNEEDEKNILVHNKIIMEWIFAYFIKSLSLPLAKATANAQLLSVQEILPNLNNYLLGKYSYVSVWFNSTENIS